MESLIIHGKPKPPTLKCLTPPPSGLNNPTIARLGVTLAHSIGVKRSLLDPIKIVIKIVII